MKTFVVSAVSFCVALLGVLRTEVAASIVPTLISSTWTKFTIDADEWVNFGFKFEIKAVGEDVFIPAQGPEIDTNLYNAPIVPIYTSNTGYSYIPSFFGHAGEVVGGFGEKYYRVPEGGSALFLYDGSLRTNVSKSVHVDIEAIRWNDSPSTEGTVSEWKGEVMPVNWASETVFVKGNIVPEPTTALLALIGGAALSTRRRRRN